MPLGCALVPAMPPANIKVTIPLDPTRLTEFVLLRSMQENHDANHFHDQSETGAYRPVLYTTDDPLPAPAPYDPGGALPAQYRGNLHLFVLAGQSNMVGVNAPPSPQTTSATIFDFDNNYRWRTGSEPIDNSAVATDPQAADTFSGYGPGMAFALRLQALRGTDYAIGLIPCAKGGTSLQEWIPSDSENSLYGICDKRIHAALTMGTLDGIFFYQGENDAIAGQAHPFDWDTAFGSIVDSWRADYGDIPIIFVQIGNLPTNDFVYWRNVQASQARVDIDGVVMVSAVGLPQNADGIHLTVSGEQSLGTSAGNAIEPLLP
jgi:hypothetical protein